MLTGAYSPNLNRLYKKNHHLVDRMTMMMNARSDMQSGAVSADKAAETLTIVTQPHDSYST